MLVGVDWQVILGVEIDLKILVFCFFGFLRNICDFNDVVVFLYVLGYWVIVLDYCGCGCSVWDLDW